MKKLISIFAITTTLLLTGCFGSSGPALDGAVEGNKFVSSDFSLEVPQDWEVVTGFDSSYPENAIVAIRNHVKDSDFVANANMTYSILDGEIDMQAFATQMLQTHRDTLTNFREVGRENLQITVAGAPATSVLNVFEGKRSPESQMLRFFQTYGYKGNIAYVVTGVHNLSEERFAREKVENIVRSFEIR